MPATMAPAPVKDPPTIDSTTLIPKKLARSRPLLDPEIVRRALRDSFGKLNPMTLAKNPVIFVVEAGAAVTTASVTFQWAAAANSATGYDVELSSDGGATFSSIGTTTATSLTKTLANGSYIWTVSALYGSVCPDVESARSSFTVAVTAGATGSVALTSSMGLL